MNETINTRKTKLSREKRLLFLHKEKLYSFLVSGRKEKHISSLSFSERRKNMYSFSLIFQESVFSQTDREEKKLSFFYFYFFYSNIGNFWVVLKLLKTPLISPIYWVWSGQLSWAPKPNSNKGYKRISKNSKLSTSEWIRA